MTEDQIIAAVAEHREGLLSLDNEQRWRSAGQLTQYAADYPKFVWTIVTELGSAAENDLRDAIATCVLEYILGHHFDEYFPKVEDLVRSGNSGIFQLFRSCWKRTQAKQKNNSERWDLLLDEFETEDQRLLRKSIDARLAAKRER